ncbi:MAG: hypothetical protein HY567_04590 [Candidatus Kerfeldbacteria bacterium]|nr:hypothetical protein [Candidatus Kerfeldbacteria bacterium]
MKELAASIGGLKVEVRELRSDFRRFEGKFDGLEEKFDGLENKFDSLEDKFDGQNNRFSNLQSSIDEYLKRTESWHDEQVILKARHDRLSDSLVKRGIISKEETLL